MTEHKHDKLVDIQETVKLFKIFSDYTRLRIIELLYTGEKCVQDISDSLETSQSAISHQLKLLRDMNVVSARKDGKQVRVREYDDCCHVEALFIKRGDKWYIEASSAFSTDVWYVGLTSKYPRAPRGIFDESVLMAQ